MSLRNFPVFTSLADSVFSDRFNRIDKLFSHLTGDAPVSFTPPYDLRQLDHEHYELTVSVPGWKEQELEIESAGGRLTITGRKESVDTHSDENTEENKVGWLHQGINHTDFRLSYNIPEHIKVTEAKLEHGLLSIRLYLEIPENEKPRRIPIQNQQDTIEHQR